MIPYGRQDISEEDIEAVTEVLRSDFLTQGPLVGQFEQAMMGRTGARHAVAANSATSALHVACLALGLKEGDSVWTSAITFVASANCARYCGASVDFVDIDPQTYNMCPDRLASKLALAEQAGRLPKIVIPVHHSGLPCDMESIGRLARRYGFKIIEDASHAVGATHRGIAIGACNASDIAIFSFHPVKVMTTGEGGMAMTNDPDLAERMRILRTHGITRDPARMSRTPDGPWYYEQIALGFNYRMTDFQAALGISQLKRLDDFIAARETIAIRYDELLATLPVATQKRGPDAVSALHLYVIRMKIAGGAQAHRRVFEALRASGVGVNLHYIPVYRQPYYEGLGFRAGYCPEAESYYSEAISLPLFSRMTSQQQDQVVASLETSIRP